MIWEIRASTDLDWAVQISSCQPVCSQASEMFCWLTTFPKQKMVEFPFFHPKSLMSPFKPTQLVLALTHMLTFDHIVHQGSEAGWEPLHEKSSRFNKKILFSAVVNSRECCTHIRCCTFSHAASVGGGKKKLFHSRDNKMVTIGVTLELEAVWSHTWRLYATPKWLLFLTEV